MGGVKRSRLLGAPVSALLIGLVKLYRLLLSPYLGGSCRFHPSCSEYALEAIGRFGAIRGTALTAARLLRCNPLCEAGMDPVPQDGALRWRRSTPAVPGAVAPQSPSR